jgi:fido (protein-threonine AMPylation protein)
MITPTDEEADEFIYESNKIEREYSQKAFEDAKQAWVTGVLNFKKDFSIDLICGIHRRLMKRLNPKIAGNIRDIPVYVGNSKGYRECMKPELIRGELQKLVDKWSNRDNYLKKAGAHSGKLDLKRKEEFVKQWHVEFEHTHPFEDGNGRTGRILMNLQRLTLGLPLLIIHEGEEQFEYYKWFKEVEKKKEIKKKSK